MTGTGAVAGLIVGAAVVAAWVLIPFAPGSGMFNWIIAQRGLDPANFEEGITLSSYIYEIIPGFIMAWLAIWLVSKATSDDAAKAPA